LWAENNECNLNSNWMKSNCMQSCGVCKKGSEKALFVGLSEEIAFYFVKSI